MQRFSRANRRNYAATTRQEIAETRNPELGEAMREQKGYLFHRYGSWFVRFMDDVRQPDGAIKRKLVCKKLDVPYGGEYRTKKSVQSFAKELLAPVNSGLQNPQATMPVSEFVDTVYLPEYVEKNLRAATVKQYSDVWENHLKPRMGKLTLRVF